METHLKNLIRINLSMPRTHRSLAALTYCYPTKARVSRLACTSPEGFGSNALAADWVGLPAQGFGFMQVHMDQNGGLRSLTVEPLQRVTARHGGILGDLTSLIMVIGPSKPVFWNVQEIFLKDFEG